MGSKDIKAVRICGILIPAKFLALGLLVLQTVGAILIMRASRTIAASENGTPYLNTTAVALSELFKLLGSLLFVFHDEQFSSSAFYTAINQSIISKPMDNLKVGVPAVLYTIQNNLLFIALSNISGPLYQVTYQLKILSTALLSVLILGRSLSRTKWLSLLILTIGSALIQWPSSSPSDSKVETYGGSTMIGVTAVLLACITSGFAGVYFEKVLKGSNTSIWMRNVQMALLGSILAIAGAFIADGKAIWDNGFFQGYNSFTWIAILLQSGGGLIVAAVLKYADNIAKCFGNALAITASCVLSYIFLGDFQPTMAFVAGTSLVIYATFSYGLDVSIFDKLTSSLKSMNSPLRTLVDPDVTPKIVIEV